MEEVINSAELINRLDQLIRIALLNLAFGKSQTEQILLLTKAGLKPKEIADILGTTANTVSVTLSKGGGKIKIKGEKNV